LVAARASLKAATAQFNHVNAPREAHVAAANHLIDIIVRAKSGQRGWGEVALDSYRALGGWLNGQKRLRGRPKKESALDSSSGDRPKSLDELGIKDRHEAALAVKVRAVPEDVYENYKRRCLHDDPEGEDGGPQVPSYRGLMRAHALYREQQDLNREPVRQAEDAKLLEEARARKKKGQTLTRVSAINRSVDTIFHPTVDPKEKPEARALRLAATVDGLMRLDPKIAVRIKQAVKAAEVVAEPAPDPKPTHPPFVSTSTWESRVATLNETVSEYRRKVHDLTRKLAKAQRELARYKPKAKGSAPTTEGGDDSGGREGLPAPEDDRAEG
jgi:hypothetical protein